MQTGGYLLTPSAPVADATSKVPTTTFLTACTLRGDVAQSWSTAFQTQALANLGLSAAWTAYSPAAASTGGTLPLTVSSTGRYLKIGRIVHVEITISITAVGTNTTGLTANLPFAAAAFRYTVPGEVIGGATVRGSIAASATAMTITNYAAAAPTTISTIVLTGIYESAS